MSFHSFLKLRKSSRREGVEVFIPNFRCNRSICFPFLVWFYDGCFKSKAGFKIFGIINE